MTFSPACKEKKGNHVLNGVFIIFVRALPYALNSGGK